MQETLLLLSLNIYVYIADSGLVEAGLITVYSNSFLKCGLMGTGLQNGGYWVYLLAVILNYFSLVPTLK